MAGQFNYEKMHKYPHLLGEDVPVWNRFIELYPDRFDTVDYDTHVGSGIDTPTGPIDEVSEQWRNLTKKRIDAIGWKGELPTIVEVKFRVGLDTLGQILGYRFLYLEAHPDIKGIPILIVCALIGPDDIHVLDHFNVPYVIV